MSNFVNTIDVLGDDTVTDSLIERTITEFKDNTLDMVGVGAFYGCNSLKTVVLPNVITLKAESFQNCSSFEVLDFTCLSTIENWTFNVGGKLTALILRNEAQVVSIGNQVANKLNTVTAGTGFIYVPAVLLDSYKSHEYWSVVADGFRALEDYTVDGTVTGELDETKI